MLHRVHVHAIADVVDAAARGIRGVLDEERLRSVHRFLVHPHEHRLKVASHVGLRFRAALRRCMHNHLAARDVNLVFKTQRHALRREGIVERAVVGIDFLHAALLARGQRHHLVAHAHDARCHLAAKPAEVEVGAQHVLHGKAEVGEIVVVADMHRFEEVKQRGTVVPRRAIRAFHHVVALEGREGEAVDIGYAERGDELAIVLHDFVKHLLVEVHQVHFVHSQCHVLDAEQRAEIGVAARLRNDARAGIYEDNGEVGRRAARNHVARILLVSRGVGDDKLTLVGREVAIRHVDGDALLALGFQPVEQQGVVNLACAGIAHALRVALQGRELVFVEFFRVEEQAADERALAIVHAAGREQAQQVLALVLVEIFFNGKFLSDCFLVGHI